MTHYSKGYFLIYPVRGGWWAASNGGSATTLSLYCFWGVLFDLYFNLSLLIFCEKISKLVKFTRKLEGLRGRGHLLVVLCFCFNPLYIL